MPPLLYRTNCRLLLLAFMTVFSDNLSVFRLTIIWLQGTFGDRAGTSGGCAKGFGQSNSCASKRSANQVLTYAARAAATSGGRARRARRGLVTRPSG